MLISLRLYLEKLQRLFYLLNCNLSNNLKHFSVFSPVYGLNGTCPPAVTLSSHRVAVFDSKHSPTLSRQTLQMLFNLMKRCNIFHLCFCSSLSYLAQGGKISTGLPKRTIQDQRFVRLLQTWNRCSMKHSLTRKIKNPCTNVEHILTISNRFYCTDHIFQKTDMRRLCVFEVVSQWQVVRTYQT